MCKNYIWVKSFFSQAKEFGVTRAVLGVSSKKDEIEYLADMDSLIALHNDYKNQVEKDMHLVENTIDKTNKKLPDLSESLINNLGQLIEKNPGKIPLRFVIDDSTDGISVEMYPRRFKVDLSNGILTKLGNMSDIKVKLIS